MDPVWEAFVEQIVPVGPVLERFTRPEYDEMPMIEPTLMPILGGRPLLYTGESRMIYGEGGKSRHG